MIKLNFKFKSIGVKLTVILVILAIACINLLATVCVRTANNSIKEQVFTQLNAIGSLKRKQVISFLEQKFTDLEIIATDLNTKVAIEKLTAYYEETSSNSTVFNVDSEKYLEIFQEIDLFYHSLKTDLDIHDLLLIDAKSGNVMYTINKHSDLGTNLNTGVYSNSGLAKLWNNIVKTRTNNLVDFSFYPPANENVTLLGVPVFDESNELLAAFVLQLGSRQINAILNESTGLGETGESYLVGRDYYMRSDSRFSKESTLLKQKVSTKSVELGLNHQTGQQIIEDYKGTEVLSFFSGLGFEEKFGADFDWAVISEIEKTEALASEKILIDKIILYGFIILIIVTISSIIIAKVLTKPILELDKATKLVADGDLTGDILVKSHDEIGSLARSFKVMQVNFRRQVDEMNNGANVLASSSSEIMAMISQLASGSAETATSVSETTTTIEEVKQTAEVSVQKATEVSETAQKISSISQEGKNLFPFQASYSI